VFSYIQSLPLKYQIKSGKVRLILALWNKYQMSETNFLTKTVRNCIVIMDY